MYDSLTSSSIPAAPSSQTSEELASAIAAPTETDSATTVDENTAFALQLQQITPTVYITPLLISANLLIWLAMISVGAGVMGENVQLYLNWGANFAPFTSDGQWWRLLTSAFLHFGIIHLAFNMYALWSVGPLTERMYGNGTYLTIYLVAAIMGGIASLIFHAQPVVGAGASGAIFGLYGALLGFLVRQEGGIPESVLKPMLKNTLFYIAYALYAGFTSEGIDNAAHIGGLIGGFATGFVFAAPLEWESRQANGWRSWLLGSVVSLLLISAGWWVTPPVSAAAKAELAFDQVLDQLIKGEETAIQRYNTRWTQVAAGQISSGEFAAELERCCVQFYQTLTDRLTQVPLAPFSEDYPMYRLLTEYTQQRLRAFQLFSEGAREDDPEKVIEAQAFLQQAAQTLQQMEKLP